MVLVQLLLTLQLVASVQEQCEESILWYLVGFISAFPTTNYEQMAFFSGRKINDLGSFDECISIESAQYALVSFPQLPGFSIGLCIPNDCTKQDLEELIFSDDKNYGLLSSIKTFTVDDQSYFISRQLIKHKTNQRQLQENQFLQINFPAEEQEQLDYSSGTKFMCILIFGLATLVTIATIVDYRNLNSQQQYKEDNLQTPLTEQANGQDIQNRMQILLSFSALRNFKSLFQARSTSNNDTLEIFNALRVFAMGYVILGHTFLILLENPLAYPQQLSAYIKSSGFYIVEGGTMAVDTFFWMSAILMTYLLLTNLNSEQEVRLGKVILFRAMRFLPAFAFVFFFNWTLLDHLGNGPVWKIGEINYNQCSGNWWLYFIFLQNLDTTLLQKCFAQSWYIAVDFQLFVIGVIVVFIYNQFSKRLGWGLCAFFAIFSCFYNLIVVGAYNLSHIPPLDPEDPDATLLYKLSYTKPYGRFTVYFIGIMCGFILYHSRQYIQKGGSDDQRALMYSYLFQSKSIRYIGLIVGLILINLQMYVQLGDYYGFADTFQPSWTIGDHMTFIFFQYILIGFGHVLILLPILLGHFPLIAKFLGSSVWIPLSKLTYTAFLTHGVTLYILILSMQQSVYLDSMTIFIVFVTAVVISMVASLIVYLLVEAPFINLEKALKLR